MKRIFRVLCLVIVSYLLAALVGCDGASGSKQQGVVPVPGEEGFFIDDGLCLVTEIRGSYKTNRKFEVVSDDASVRVYDDLYLYEGDNFAMYRNVDQIARDIYYDVESEEDLQYARPNERLPQLDVKEDGIYKLTFDVDSKKFTVQYKSQISIPSYEEMDGCDLFDGDEFLPMTASGTELVLRSVRLQMGQLISFYNHGNVHLSNYKVVISDDVYGKYAQGVQEGDKFPSVMIGGVYDVFVDPVTYQMRLELKDPQNAVYSLCVLENDRLEKISPSAVAPYVFEHVARFDKYASPLFFTEKYTVYELNVVDNDCVLHGMIKEEGTYKLTVNLLDFTVFVSPVAL